MAVEVAPITDPDVAAVADFLHTNLNKRVSPSTWTRVMSVPWKVEAPNHGFMLRDGQRVVGVYLAFYSERPVAGRMERFCNLASWAVLPHYRFHSIRLLKALLAQDGYHFTDLAPSDKVESVNTRLRFRYFDPSVAVIPNLPWPARPGRCTISADPAIIEGTLAGEELELFRNHVRAPAAHHLVLTRSGQSCYVMFRERWWRGLPTFAAILHVSDPDVFQRAVPPLTRHFLIRHRLPATLAERRIVRGRPPLSIRLPDPKAMVRKHDSRISKMYARRYLGTIPPKMYRSASLEPHQIDDLYSELVCVPGW